MGNIALAAPRYPPGAFCSRAYSLFENLKHDHCGVDLQWRQAWATSQSHRDQAMTEPPYASADEYWRSWRRPFRMLQQVTVPIKFGCWC